MREFIRKALHHNCGCCGKRCDNYYDHCWQMADAAIALSHPPNYLQEVYICDTCYNSANGPKMEQVIRGYLINVLGLKIDVFDINKNFDEYRAVMPNGADGYVCTKCNEFCPYVNPNQPDGSYICPSHP